MPYHQASPSNQRLQVDSRFVYVIPTADLVCLQGLPNCPLHRPTPPQLFLALALSALGRHGTTMPFIKT